jgi:hypothetical protein
VYQHFQNYHKCLRQTLATSLKNVTTKFLFVNKFTLYELQKKNKPRPSVTSDSSQLQQRLPRYQVTAAQFLVLLAAQSLTTHIP